MAGTLTLGLDQRLATLADELFAQEDLTLSAVVDVIVRQRLQFGRVPLIIEAGPLYSPPTVAALERRMERTDAGRDLVVRSVDDLKSLPFG